MKPALPDVRLQNDESRHSATAATREFLPPKRVRVTDVSVAVSLRGGLPCGADGCTEDRNEKATFRWPSSKLLARRSNGVLSG